MIDPNSTETITLYVSWKNGNDENDGLTPNTPMKRPSTAIEKFPKIYAGKRELVIVNGGKCTNVHFQGFTGGEVILRTDTPSVKANIISISFEDCTKVNVSDITSLASNSNFEFKNCSFVHAENLLIKNADFGMTIVNCPNIEIKNVEIDDAKTALFIKQSTLYIQPRFIVLGTELGIKAYYSTIYMPKKNEMYATKSYDLESSQVIE